MKILVAYATRRGATQEVAETVADTLRAHGADVQFQAARDVRHPAGRWDLIVVGAPLYSGDLARFADVFADLADPDVMAQAWR